MTQFSVQISGQFRIIFLTIFWLHVCGCGVETNKLRADHAKCRADIRQLLFALQTYKEEKGMLPRSLDELQQIDSTVKRIDCLQYSYSPKGMAVADGTIWIISIEDPLDKGKMIVGKLPIEVDVKFSK